MMRGPGFLKRARNSEVPLTCAASGLERYALLFFGSMMGNFGFRPSTTSLVIM
jgi:hypothetical protein